MNSCEFRVGDRIRIKDLEKAKHVFGFVGSMIPLCGERATIINIESNKYHKDYRGVLLGNWSCSDKNTGWIFTTSMIEHTENIIPRILDEEE